MTITYSPSSLELTEFVGTTGTTVTLTPDSQTVIYIEKVTTSPSPLTPVTISVSNVGTKSFTFSSNFSDMFDRTIYYVSQTVDKVKVFNTVKRFVDLPSSYKALYRYVPPSAETMEIAFTITLYSFTGIGTPSAPWGSGNPVGNPTYAAYRTTATWILDLRQNWESSQLALQNAVKLGSGYKNAVKKYPEVA